MKTAATMKTAAFLLVSLVCLTGTTTNAPEAIAVRPGKDFALFFAVSDYAEWTDLANPLKEAEAIAKDLSDLYGFDCKVMKNPTRNEIYDKIAEYSRKTFADDAQLLIFFSGHGNYLEEKQEGFFIPKDGRKTDLYQDSWLPFARLKQQVDGIKCNHILLAIDACYSGTFDERIAYRRNNPDDDFDRPSEAETARNQRISDMLRGKTRLFLSSGGKERSDDRSKFATQWKEALLSLGGSDGLLDFYGLYHQFLKKASPEPHSAAFGQHEQGANFLFAYKPSPKSPALNPQPADRDGDNIPDARDQCPDEWGNTTSGCLDSDGDGVFNKDDQCPYEKGAADRHGCPAPADRDGDGVPDLGDACPDTRGLPQYQGCPDSDADGVPDHKDDCPAQKGLPAKNGCPDDPAPNFMVRITGGTFEMGDAFGEGSSDEKPPHSVTLSDFYLAKTEVTLGEFKAFADAAGYKTDAEKGDGSYVWDGRSWTKKVGVNWRHDVAGNTRPASEHNHPVVHVSWNDAIEYCNWLSRQHKLTPVYTISSASVTANWSASGYRLPTEAEWEYAARQRGQKVRFGNGKDVVNPSEINFDARADYKQTYSVAGTWRQKTTPVAAFAANSLGLHDMSGNVWEWCWDWYDGSYYEQSKGARDPRGPTSGSYRVLRGGSWGYNPQYVRAAYRYSSTPSGRSSGVGFRLSRTVTL